MKILVEHDGNGNIQAVGIVESAPGLQITPTPLAGNTVSEVDVPGLQGAPGSPAFDRKIRAIMKASRIQVGPAKLVKKGAKRRGSHRNG